MKPLKFDVIPHMMFQQNPADRRTSPRIPCVAPHPFPLPHPVLPAAIYNQRQQHVKFSELFKQLLTRYLSCVI